MNLEEVQYVVREMYRLANEYQYDVGRYQVSTPEEIFNVVRQIPYVRDIDRCGYEECLQRPSYAISGGDCDDKSIFAGAAFCRLNIPWRFVTASYRPDEQQEHVYLEIYVNGSWRPFDATYAWNKIYQERTPYTKKIVWENPMITKLQNGVVTLTGAAGGLGIAPVALAGLLSSIASLLGKLKDLPLIGGLFRGKTQHLDYDTALGKSQEIGRAAVSIYQNLPDDRSKTYALNLARSYFENFVMPDLGHRWENAIANDYARVIAGTYTGLSQYWKDSDAFKFQYYMAQPLFYFLFLEDVERLEESIKVWFTEPVKRIVWDPLDSYLKENYATSTSGGTTAPPAPSSNLAGILPVLGIGLAFALLTGKTKR